MHQLAATALACVLTLSAATARAEDGQLEEQLAALEQQVPADLAQLAQMNQGALSASSQQIDEAALAVALAIPKADVPDIHRLVERLVLARQRVDSLVTRVLETRHDLADRYEDFGGRPTLSQFLQLTSQLIDLSGRLHDHASEGINEAAFRVAPLPAERVKLIDLLAEKKSTVGTAVMSWALLDPLDDATNGARPASPATKTKLLQMIAAAGRIETLEVVTEFVFSAEATPEQIITGVETIRTLGLPQDPRPNQDATLPKPMVTAAELHELLTELKASVLSATGEQKRQELLAWLGERNKLGLTEAVYRHGDYEVRPGDWLLMRNPSPYNLFTDLNPGLFTHVGVVALEQGTDGKRRMVIVDMPERGTHMPATNVDVFLERTLNYCFLRHRDPNVARKMGDVAVSLIDSQTEFDLNFRTERVEQLKGKPLANRKIKTYCAGLLLLCAQETGLARDEFFPVPEQPARGQTIANLEQLGITFGRDLISPTGPLFARNMRIIGRREAMYDPSREIDEAIYDHFARQLAARKLEPADELFQSLRVRMAKAAKNNPLLAKALAAAANVSSDIDLVAAAKTAAVVETLDEIAYGNSGNFRMAMRALGGATAEELAEGGWNPADIARLMKLRKQHAELWRRRQSNQLTPAAARRELIAHYVALGRQQLDERFFGGEQKSP